MMTINAHRGRPALLARIGGVALLVGTAIVGSGGSVHAGERSRLDLFGIGPASYDTVRDEYVGTGTADGRPRVTGYRATVGADDRSAPAPGVCEPGHAEVVLVRRDRVLATLTAHGPVCGESTSETSVVHLRFVGSFTVTEASTGDLRDVEGWLGIAVTSDDRLSVEVVSHE